MRRSHAIAGSLATLASLHAERVKAASARIFTLGATGRTAADWPVYVADELGYFKRYNVQPETVYSSVASTAQQMTAGAIDIGTLSSTQTVLAIENGAPLHYFLDRITTPPYTIVAKPSISTLEGLKGQTVIIGGPTDITRVFLDIMLAKSKVRADDLVLTYAGATNERYAALKNGSVGAAMLFPPLDFQAKSEGFKILGNLQDDVRAFPFVGFAVTERFLEAQADVVIAFTKGYLRGVAWLQQPQNRNRAIDMLVRVANVTKENATQSYDELVVKYNVFNRTGETKPQVFAQVITALSQLGLLKPPLPLPTKFYDNHIMHEATRQIALER